MKHAFYISIILILTALDIYLISRLAWKEYSNDSIGGFTQEYVVSNITGMDQLLKNGGLTLDSTAVFKPDGTACGLFEDGTRRYLVCRISQYDCDVCTGSRTPQSGGFLSESLKTLNRGGRNHNGT